MRVEIVSNSGGFGSIKVDGIDLSRVVTAAEVQILAGGHCGVRLELVPCEVVLEAETEAKLVEIQRKHGIKVTGFKDVT